MPISGAYLLVFQLLKLLLSKGLITTGEVVSVPVSAAEMLRGAYDGEPEQHHGECTARSLETLAAWLSPQARNLGGNTR